MNTIQKYTRTGLYKWLLILACTLVNIQIGWAQIPKSDFPAVPNPPKLVNDLAGIMDASAVTSLENELVQFDKEQSTQITVVTIKSVGSYEIAQYATELAHYWGIGRKGKDNGVLLLVAVNDRKVNISTGYGAEGAITDGIAGTIIRQDITPHFKNGDYTTGIVSGVRSIKEALNGEYVNDEPTSAETPPLGITIFIIFIIIIVILSSIGRGGKGGGGNRRGGEYMSRRGDDFLTGAILGSLLNGGRGGGFGGGFGGGGFGGGSSGGGFGGFGGGGFGGGGASGSW